jgi:hypothetical protein
MLGGASDADSKGHFYFAILISLQFLNTFLSSYALQRFLEELVDQSNLGQNPPPVIFINNRKALVEGADAFAKTLCNEITSNKNSFRLSKFPALVKESVKQLSASSPYNYRQKKPWPAVPLFVWSNLAKLAEFIKEDICYLNRTLENLKIVFKIMASLPRKPVIIIGRVV